MTDEGLERIRRIDAEAKRTGRDFAIVDLEDRFPEGSTERAIVQILAVSLKELTRSEIIRIMISAWGHGLVMQSQLEAIRTHPVMRILGTTGKEQTYGFAGTQFQDKLRDQFREEDPSRFGAVVSYFISELVREVDEQSRDGVQMAHFAYYTALLNPDTYAFESAVEDLKAQINYVKHLKKRLPQQ